MNILPCPLEGPLIIEPKVFGDPRGFFVESYNRTRYRQAGLTIAQTLFNEPYLSTSPEHQGLLLHSVYHRPNGWDHLAPGQKIPNGESSMWGDYHARELALLLWREARGERCLTFFGDTGKSGGGD